MTTNEPIITAEEHERIYRDYWRGLYASKAELIRLSGRSQQTIDRLIATVPPRFAAMPDSLSPDDRLRWAVQHRICLVCAGPTNRKCARLCRDCERDWKYCPDCAKPMPLSVFTSQNEPYCAYHKEKRLHPMHTGTGPRIPRKYVRKARDLAKEAQTAEIVRLVHTGATWKTIGALVNLNPNTAYKRYLHWQRRHAQKASTPCES